MATHLKQSHMDQWFMGLERQVLDDLVIEGRLVHRRYGDFIGYTNTGVATRAAMLWGPRFSQPLGWTDPRVVRIGARYSF